MVFILILITYSLPIDSPIMDYIEYLQVRGIMDIPTMKPYEHTWVLTSATEIFISERSFMNVERKLITSLRPFVLKNEDFSWLCHLHGDYQYTPEYYHGYFDYRAGGQLTQSLRFSHGLRFKRGSDIDSLGPKPWKNFQVYLDEGLLQFNTGSLNFLIGRRNYQLGYFGNDDLLLSSNTQGYDGFSFSLPFHYFEFHTIFSVLDASRERYLVFHRIGLHLPGFLKCGFSEALLFSETLQPLYLNPFLPYYLAQWGIDRDDNIMWCFDIQLQLWRSLFYGELLIDDYMYENDPYPDKIAYRLGIKTTFMNPLLATIHYTFVDKWVYTHHHSVNIYEQNNQSLGFPLGNDVDRIGLIVKYMTVYGIYPSGEITYERKGEGSIFLPYEEEGGDWNPPFPSGVVEKTLTFRFGVGFVMGDLFHGRLSVGKQYSTNYGHAPDNDQSDILFNASLWIVL